MPRLYNLNSYKALRRQLRNNPTPTEQKLWRHLQRRHFHGLLFRRQHGIGSYIVDFYCPQLRLVIEVDGSIHKDHKVRENDKLRQKFLESCYIRVLRFTNDEVLNNIEEVLEKLEKSLPPASPSLIKEGDTAKPRGK